MEELFATLVFVTIYPPWNYHSPWKWMVGILVSFWGGLFSGAMLVSGSVNKGKWLGSVFAWCFRTLRRVSFTTHTSKLNVWGLSLWTPVVALVVNLESLLWNPIQECFPLKGENIEVKQVKSCRANRRYNADPMHEGGFLRATAVEVAEVLCEVWVFF